MPTFARKSSSATDYSFEEKKDNAGLSRLLNRPEEPARDSCAVVPGDLVSA